MTGIILRQIGGFYYVESGGAVYECRARGLLRKEQVIPAAGDRAVISVRSDGSGTVEELLPRKNCLLRPLIANLDLLVLVISVTDPPPNLLTVDRMTALASRHGIEPLVVVNKSDLGDPSALADIYTGCGFEVFAVSARDPGSIAALGCRLAGWISAFTGNSGVGKSSILNQIIPDLLLETQTISRKLGRGRHTTRTVSLYPFEGGYIADTPGFTSLELFTPILKDELSGCFREFVAQTENSPCRFTGCTHTKEPGCAVLDALAGGRIPPSRHASYLFMLDEVKDIKLWEIRKREKA